MAFELETLRAEDACRGRGGSGPVAAPGHGGFPRASRARSWRTLGRSEWETRGSTCLVAEEGGLGPVSPVERARSQGCPAETASCTH